MCLVVYTLQPAPLGAPGKAPLNFYIGRLPEPFQLLGKAIMVQQANPEAAVLPVLVCRRAHPTLFWASLSINDRGRAIYDWRASRPRC